MGKTLYDVPALRTALRLINVLGEAREAMGVSELSRAAGTNKNMAFRLLNTLQAEGWVGSESPGPRYSLTLRPFQVCSKPLSRISAKQAAEEPLRELWARLGESVYLGVLRDDKVLYLDHLDSVRPVRVAGMVGGSYPLHCSAPGKALLAFGGDELFGRLAAAGFERFTDNTITGPEALRQHLERVRAQGWALDNEEYARGIVCLAAPVFDHAGRLAGTIGVSVTTLDYTLERAKAELLGPIVATARDISAHLGADSKEGLRHGE